MELREVEVFLALAEELHFGRAATRLRVTQGRVSQTIRSLESEIGGTLFERSNRQVSLTPLGARFLVGAQRGYDELQRALRESRAAARDITSQLRVGYLPSMGNDVVTGLVAAFERRYPECHVYLNTLHLRHRLDPEPALLAGETDIALCWSPGGDGTALETPRVVVGPVLQEVPRAVLVPGDHPLTAHRSVSLDDLADYVLINPGNNVPAHHRDRWTPQTTPSGRQLRHTVDDIVGMTHRAELSADDVLTLVARGHGLHLTVATLLEHIPFRGLALVPISDLPPMVLVPVWAAGAENATYRAFANTAAEAAKALRDKRNP
ncbi:LysR family transcriptional regulator [Prauserella cavernicola]|uniref:LysR family transcriptional regulator n=1 Tax=Prauserella cavernicola TaxID=2800127 RepID=A0A934QS88_9PSEU|nr:LysR family transcriptional regulator [Prauserella cavernicola]MBK1785600.1 LysR family transcriptional regulator [Prauserella cavernicola]